MQHYNFMAPCKQLLSMCLVNGVNENKFYLKKTQKQIKKPWSWLYNYFAK